MLNPRFLGILLAITLFASPSVSWAQENNAADDPVLARVNGEDVHRSEVMEMARALPAQYQQQLAQIFPLLVQRVVDFRLAGKAGRAAGMADDDEVKTRLAKAEEQIIREIYLQRTVEARITGETMQARYQTYLEANPPGIEQHARHILVATEEEAKEVVTKLDGGADFAELAKESSTGPSGAQGGDLGYFVQGQMVPEFDEAASVLEPGEYSKTPVKTQFGWHVIKVEDRRPVAAASFEEMEPQLRADIARETVEVVLQELRDGAKIEIISTGEAASDAGAKTE